VTILLAGCSGVPSDVTPDIPSEEIPEGSLPNLSLIHYTFEEAVERSNCAVIAEFVSYNQNSNPNVRGAVEYIFNVKEVLRGYVPENPIRVEAVRANAHVIGTERSYRTGTDKFTVGNEYLLLLIRYDQLFEDYTKYSFAAHDMYIPANDTRSGMMYGEFISDSFRGDAVSTIRNATPPCEDKWKALYTTSEDMAEIVEFSEMVLEVRVAEVVLDVPDRTTYSAEVINVLKGPMPNKMEDGRMGMTLMKDSVEVGGHYIVMLTPIDPPTLVHTQSSLRSVISMDDTEAVEEVRRILARTGPGDAAE
jgi:hypothetical protein